MHVTGVGDAVWAALAPRERVRLDHVTDDSTAPVCRNVHWRCRDGQVERLASGHEDVLWAVVVERFAGESAVESFQPQARDVEEPQPFVFGCPPE